MNLRVFNACLLIGWLMTTVGVSLISRGVGIAVGGCLLIALTLGVAWFGGLRDKP